MSQESDSAAPLVRIPTGVPGLDDLLHGGLWKAGIYILMGSPGSGKTILANQMCFHHVRNGGRAVYVTLLAETHARMLSQLRVMSFFDRGAVGSSIQYLNAFSTVEAEGLSGMLEVLRRAVRDHRADLLVLDGMVTAGMMSPSNLDYKKFINELLTWMGMIGCTAIFLSSAAAGGQPDPGHTMVDGLIELRTLVPDMTAIRHLRIAKLRGSSFTEGNHHYLISADGIRVFPRFEAHLVPDRARQSSAELLSVGIARLDQMLGGGLRGGSITLALGSSGSGKTTLGLQFLAAGASRGDKALHFGFFENTDDIRGKGDRFGFDFSGLLNRGLLEIVWHSPAEGVLDILAADLLDRVRKGGIRRLFVDGLVGFKESGYQERVPGFFSALSNQLAALGVTTLITEETRELFIQEVQVPTPGVSAIFQNILFMRQVDTGAELARLMSVMKTRDTGHDRTLYGFDIRKDGIHIGDPLQSSDTPMQGAARPRVVAGRKRPRGKR